MEHRISHRNMDELLKGLEDDYVQAIKGNDAANVETFVEQFLYDSWNYNDQNIETIKTVMSRYSKGEIYETTFSGAFNEMVDHVQDKLEELDASKEYPVIQEGQGASTLIAFVNGLVVQYFTGCCTADDLRNRVPRHKKILLHALGTD
ncbi:hypothetical protein U0355_01325 [Salimicrobium sp. PL1-032A]|uniref:hypothetical protein n=1 Tax=Salimicrobium sp. PL1-032A TaxID=3095364 RepID=UPI0032613E33